MQLPSNVLLIAEGKKPASDPPPKFFKRMDEISSIALPLDQPMQIVVSLADQALVGQFVGLWPSPRTTENWIQKNWHPLITSSVTCYAVGRGFFLFEFISRDDRDLIFRNGSYFMGPQGLYLNRWTPDFDPVWMYLRRFRCGSSSLISRSTAGLPPRCRPLATG
jgi:hypothetical protein